MVGNRQNGLVTFVSFSLSVLVSKGCSTKVPQPGWLEVTEMYSLTVLEAGKQGIAGPGSLKAVSVASSRPLPAPGACWQPWFLPEVLQGESGPHLS